MEKETKPSYNPITLTWAAPSGRTLGPVMTGGSEDNRELFTSGRFVVIMTVFLWMDGGAGINPDLTLTEAHEVADLSFSLQILHVLMLLLGLSCPVFFFFFNNIVTLPNWWCMTGWLEWTFLLWLSRIHTEHSCTHTARHLCHYEHDTSFREKTLKR